MMKQHVGTANHSPHELAAALGLPPEAAERWVANGVEHDDAPIAERVGFMCAIDFHYELGEVSESHIYESVEALRADHDCCDDCGIVEVTVTLKRVVTKGKLL